MQSTVLAGPVQFSPVDIAAILAILVLSFLVVTAPGWAVLATACAKRAARRTWLAGLGGAVLGVAISAATWSVGAALAQSLPSSLEVPVGVVLAWLACWGVAYLLRPSRRPEDGSEPPAAGSASQGWGR